VLLHNGSLPAAREAYETALVLCKTEAWTRCMAEAANNSGYVAQQEGDFETALARLNEAAREWRSLSQRPEEARTLSNMGLLYRQTGDYQRAIGLYDRALRQLSERDALPRARVFNNLGFCYQSVGEYDRARRYFERALEIEISIPAGARDALRARLNLGRNFISEQRPDRALPVLQRTLADAKSEDDRPAIANALNNLGQAYTAAGQPIEARPRLEEALKLHRILQDTPLVASDLHYLGVTAQASGDIDSARELLTAAIDLRRSGSLRDAQASSLYTLASLEFNAGNLLEASSEIEKALSLLETVRTEVPGPTLRASFYARKRSYFDLLVEIALKKGTPESAGDALLAAERGRGRSLLDMLAQGSILHAASDEMLRREAIQRKIDLLSVQIASAPPERESELRRQVDDLATEDQNLEAAIREHVAQKSARPLQSIMRLQRDLLPRDSALLEFHLGPRQSYLWLVTPREIRIFRLPARAAVESQVSKAVSLFDSIVERRRSPALQARFRESMKKVSNTLFGLLAGSTLPRQIIIVPDGVLNRLSFAALTLPSESQPIGLARDLIQIPAAAFLGAGKSPRPLSGFPKALLAVADPVFSRNDPRVRPVETISSERAKPEPDFARLPFFADVDAARSLLPRGQVVVLQGFDANTENLNRVQLEDFGILHFSTHAFIDDEIPELSRIALSMYDRAGRQLNGFLRPGQLRELHLNGSIVVLSACDTALGKQVTGEGLMGLTASLFDAGASRLVLSLDKVDADASSDFFAAVYKELFGPQRASLERSMTIARNTLARSKRWSDPYYWAPFVLYGRPLQQPVHGKQ
jgi:CHAT domain-containing protein/Tfp pilus assembly protein PilF